uniref:Uncharacterized protein n=1 Tax=Oryza barthii TaxID=65489 RepID=A0A0D3HLS8_9ORYZ
MARGAVAAARGRHERACRRLPSCYYFASSVRIWPGQANHRRQAAPRARIQEAEGRYWARGRADGMQKEELAVIREEKLASVGEDELADGQIRAGKRRVGEDELAGVGRGERARWRGEG